MNRLVRTRMPGGVGGASEQSGSLSRFLLASCMFLVLVKQAPQAFGIELIRT